MFFTFIVGCTGLVWRASNLLLILIFGELMLVSIAFGFVLVSKFWVVSTGQVYALAILNSAAVESAIGLVLIINVYRTTGSVIVNFLKCLRG